MISTVFENYSLYWVWILLALFLLIFLSTTVLFKPLDALSALIHVSNTQNLLLRSEFLTLEADTIRFGFAGTTLSKTQMIKARFQLHPIDSPTARATQLSFSTAKKTA